MSILNSTVLVIDHSPAVNRLLSHYLKRIGFSEILTCETADSGVKTFEDLVFSSKKLLVFLGYHFPDSIASNIVPQLFGILPDAKIIIESSLKEDDPRIVDLFSEGVFYYLPKPIRFDDLTRVIETIEKETEEFSNTKIDERRILGLLKTIKKISLLRLAEYCNCQINDLQPFLKKLEEKSILQEINTRKEIGCRDCNSINVHHVYSCTGCDSENFRKTVLIEHFPCSNISSKYDYEDDKCPKCRKKIKIMGVDYKIYQNFNVCSDCKEKFSIPNQKLICNNCNSKFLFDEINWIKSRTFSFTTSTSVVEKSEFNNIDKEITAKPLDSSIV